MEFYLIALLGVIVFTILDFASFMQSSKQEMLKIDVLKQYLNLNAFYIVSGIVVVIIVILGLQRGEENVIEQIANVDIPGLGVIVSFVIGLLSQVIVLYLRKILLNPLRFKVTDGKVESGK